MVNRCCLNCGEIFIKKSTYDYHINRKIPCVKNTHFNTPNTQKLLPENKIFKETNDNIFFSCEFCNQTFSRKYNLDRHQNKSCKQKQNNDELENNNELKNNDELEKKENIIDHEQNKITINNDKTIINEDKINLILKQNKELKNEIEKLKCKIKKTKKNKSHIVNNNNNINNVNINSNNVNSNNVINVVNNIINFNDMNYNNVDKKLFIEPIMDRKLFGKAIILKMIENIYINENLPEYQNLVITDKNRGYVKVFNNGKWKTDNLTTINLVLNGIVDHSKTIIDELYSRYLNNNQVKNRINTSEKYIGYCDLEHLEELKDAQENDDIDNKNEIKRCEEFRDMVFKDTINLFHDNKNILLKLKKDNKLIDLL
jgi:hypothetical protein